MRVATVTERLEQVLEREAPSWGIRPVPPEHRRLSGFDFGVLWADLAIGLLVLLTGAVLVPSLGLPSALLAIAVGSVIGCIPLALVGLAGAREGVPGMVLAGRRPGDRHARVVAAAGRRLQPLRPAGRVIGGRYLLGLCGGELLVLRVGGVARAGRRAVRREPRRAGAGHRVAGGWMD